MKSAIIGLGAISSVHYQAILGAGGEVVAVCDCDPARLEAFREKTACPAAAYTDYKEMLAKECLDAVHICTPHHLHADMTVDALAAGCHVLCEKPLCIKEEDIDRIIGAEAVSGKQVAVCLQNRYNASNLAAMDCLGGRPAAAGHGTVVWNRDAAYYASGDWRGKWETEGGGVMINQALHTLDLLIWYMGMPDSVQATCENRRLAGVIEVEDTASALFRYRDGRMFNFYASNASSADFPVLVNLVSADGKKLAALSDALTVNGTPLDLCAAGEHVGKAVWGTGHARLVQDFYTCIEEGRPFAIDAIEGAKVVRAILAMYRSNGQEISLKRN